MPTKTHPKRVLIQELAENHDCEVITIDGHDDAIVGTGFVAGVFHVFYNSEKIIKTLMKRDKMSQEDALEWFDFNIDPLGNLEGGPIFIDPLHP